MSEDEQDNGFESDTDKRAHHNALERKRRDLIKDSFVMLRDVLPVFQGDKVRASRAQILTKGADYIGSLKRKNTVHQQDIEELKRHSKALDEQIRLLQKAKTPENIASAAVVVESAKTAIKNLDTFHGPENKDSTESEDSSDPDSYVTPRKRLR